MEYINTNSKLDIIPSDLDAPCLDNEAIEIIKSPSDEVLKALRYMQMADKIIKTARLILPARPPEHLYVEHHGFGSPTRMKAFPNPAWKEFQEKLSALEYAEVLQAIKAIDTAITQLKTNFEKCKPELLRVSRKVTISQY